MHVKCGECKYWTREHTPSDKIVIGWCLRRNLATKEYNSCNIIDDKKKISSE